MEKGQERRVVTFTEMLKRRKRYLRGEGSLKFKELAQPGEIIYTGFSEEEKKAMGLELIDYPTK